MDEFLSGWKRSHMCTEVTAGQVGEQVTLMGWMQRRRDLGGVLFVWLRDRSGIIQILFDERHPQAQQTGATLRNEYVIAVRGTVLARTPEMINPEMRTGDIEVLCEEIKILSSAETPPFNVFEENEISENLRLKYRFLDLRRPKMQHNLMLRHRLVRSLHEYLDQNGFIEIETPILGKSTPEGARDYLVPSRVHPGKFYALPQSPQLFKQILMASGFDRYYQMARCFRDEDLRADRQPEFTQVDIEMSFVEMEDVLRMGEGMLQKLFRDTIGYELPNPLPRITYADAMRRFGSDKPDTRFGMELQDITATARDSGFSVFRDAVAQGGVVIGINARGCAHYSRKQIDALTAFVRGNRAGGLAWLAFSGEETRGSFTKFLSEQEMGNIKAAMNAQDQDLLLFLAGSSSICLPAAGALRLELGRQLNLMNPERFDVLWVTEFPFFEFDEETQTFIAMHHAFTSPLDEDIPLLETQPHRVRAKAYDVVVNGTEVSSGSIRIHSAQLQETMFRLLGIGHDEAWDRFGFLLEAFRYGVPPHGGMAPGLDRLAMLLAREESIREVIAFPKLQNAACPMTEAPGLVDEEQLRDLQINLLKKQ